MAIDQETKDEIKALIMDRLTAQYKHEAFLEVVAICQDVMADERTSIVSIGPTIMGRCMMRAEQFKRVANGD